MVTQLLAEDLRLRRRVVGLVRQLRKATNMAAVTLPRYSADDLYHDGSQILRRRVVILLSSGCSVPTCTMCPFTNYNLYGTHRAPPDPVLQLAQEFERNPPDGTDLVSVYNDGSFFADSEVTAEQRVGIARVVRDAGVLNLMVESLPQFMTPARLDPVVEALRGGALIVGIGLQSSNDFVRQVCVGTSFTRPQFERAVAVAYSSGVVVKSYVMIKPPFLDDAAALRDVVETAQYLCGIGAPSVTLCPTRVAENTVVHALFESGLYEPPHIFTVLAALHAVLHLVDVRVAVINLTGEDFESVTAISGSDAPARVVLEAIVAFNRSRDPADLRLASPVERCYAEHRDRLERAPRVDPRGTLQSLLGELEVHLA